jgi:hypothetical protein
MEDVFIDYRRNSKGCFKDEPAKVHPNIMFGHGSYLDLFTINQHQITHVLNCAKQDSCPKHIIETYDGKYACIEAEDGLDVCILDWYPLFRDTLSKFLKDPTCNVVYVHCRAGMNRSGFLTALYLCEKFQYNYESLCKSILVQRPCALENMAFHKQVQEYIKKLS